jgi:hypothetical protein
MEARNLNANLLNVNPAREGSLERSLPRGSLERRGSLPSASLPSASLSEDVRNVE